jgi:hypothetical protein
VLAITPVRYASCRVFGRARKVERDQSWGSKERAAERVSRGKRGTKGRNFESLPLFRSGDKREDVCFSKALERLFMIAFWRHGWGISKRALQIIEKQGEFNSTWFQGLCTAFTIATKKMSSRQIEKEHAPKVQAKEESERRKSPKQAAPKLAPSPATRPRFQREGNNKIEDGYPSERGNPPPRDSAEGLPFRRSTAL